MMVGNHLKLKCLDDCLWPLRPKIGSQGMCPILDFWNLDGFTLIALSMTYDDDDFIYYKECIGIMD